MLGRGIVHPVDSMDATPWSPELLEYLACQLIDEHYDLKKTLREIATSQIYQARCEEPVDSTPHLATASPGGPDPLPQGEREILFRGPLARRMTAEQFLDAVWRITNTSPSKSDAVDPQRPDATFEHRANEPIRVSLMKPDLLMRSLGRPNRDQVVTTRPESLSTLQALDLTNGPAMSALMAGGAAKWRADHPHQSPDETIETLYLATLCRMPTEFERKIARQILGESITDDSLADFLWTLFMLPEFQLVK